MLKARLYFAVFFCGAAVMVLELCGSRLLAPFLGTSIYVWTSLIGIVLGFLSLGYYWGGRLADRNPSFSLLSRIVLSAALVTAAVGLLNVPVLAKIYRMGLDLRLSAVFASALLFSVPSVLLGMVSPFSLRLDIAQVSDSGRTAGRIYALSTLGSIFGTFLSGFFLLSYLGTQQVLTAIAGVLLLCSLVIDWRDKLVLKLVAAAFITVVSLIGKSAAERIAAAGVRDFDTDYYRVLVVDSKESGSGRAIRLLVTDPIGAQSAIYPDDPELMPPRYLRFYDLAFLLRPDLKKALLLGGGAYSYLRHFLDKAPQAEIDSVEIDPGMTEIARKHFNLIDTPRHHIIHADARVFLARTADTYQVAFVDVFSSAPSVPFHLVTTNALSLLSRALDDRGIVLMNIIAAREGKNSEFLRAVYATFKQVFPHVYVFPTGHPDQADKPQNIVIAAAKQRDAPRLVSSEQYYDDLLHRRWTPPEEWNRRSAQYAYTDDFAPVERHLLPVILDMQAGAAASGGPGILN